MNTIKKYFAFILVIAAIILVQTGCGESQPCSTEVTYLQWKSYELEKDDSISTFYNHIIKLKNIMVEKSIRADSLFTLADTIYTETDTTYIAADTTITLDTVIVNSLANFVLYNEIHGIDSNEIELSTGQEISFGSEEIGNKYSHILVRCDSISFDTNFVILNIRNSEINQDCSSW